MGMGHSVKVCYEPINWFWKCSSVLVGLSLVYLLWLCSECHHCFLVKVSSWTSDRCVNTKAHTFFFFTCIYPHNRNVFLNGWCFFIDVVQFLNEIADACYDYHLFQ